MKPGGMPGAGPWVKCRCWCELRTGSRVDFSTCVCVSVCVGGVVTCLSLAPTCARVRMPTSAGRVCPPVRLRGRGSLRPALAAGLPVQWGSRSSWRTVEGMAHPLTPVLPAPLWPWSSDRPEPLFPPPTLKRQPRDWWSLFGQIIASHHMQSISFASGGDTVRPGLGVDSRPLCPPSPETPCLCPSVPPPALLGLLRPLPSLPRTWWIMWPTWPRTPSTREVRPGGGGRGPWAGVRQPAEAPLMLCHAPQPATSWSAARASPRASSAPWAKPSSCASNSTCTAPPGLSSPREGTGLPAPSPRTSAGPAPPPRAWVLVPSLLCAPRGPRLDHQDPISASVKLG